MKEAAENIKRLIDIQKQNGNYNYNKFMYGMLIGLECAYHTLLGEHEYTHTKPPTEWLEDKIPKDFVPEVANVQKVNMYGEVYPQYPFDTFS